MCPSPRPRQLRHRDAAGRDERRQRQRDLVADTAGRVLVGGRLRQRGEVHPLPRRDHRGGPAADLAPASSRSAGSPSPAPTSARRRRSRGCRRRPPSRSGSSLSSPPSRLARITSTASCSSRQQLAPSDGLQVVGAERVGQHLVDGLDAAAVSTSSVGAAVLAQQLAAAAARHEHVAVAVHAHEREQPAAAGRVQRPTSAHSAHSATPYAAFSTLQPDDHAPVVDERRGAHREAASTARTPVAIASIGLGPQRRPSRRSPSHAHSFMYGLPSAAGARTCPTSPATATIVTM